MTPKFTVVIPARNEGGTISIQLDAVLAQDWSRPWELIVVDNGSSDDTEAIVSQYVERDPRVRLVQAHEKPGLAYARNVAMRHAYAESVAFVDADDIVADGWLEAMANASQSHEYVAGALELYRLNPEWLARSRGSSPLSEPPNFLHRFPTAPGGNHCLSRAAWRRVGGYDESSAILEDIDMGMRLWLRGIEMHYEPRAVVHYRYRTTASELWRQGLFYGASRPIICKRLARAGVQPPSRLAGWRSWVMLLFRAMHCFNAPGRATFAWAAGNRVGQLRGSLRARSLYL